MNNYKTPGVYVVERSTFPPSIAAVETAIPVFIGYTEKAEEKEPNDLQMKPHRITSYFDYERFFGEAQPETGIEVTISNSTPPVINAKNNSPSNYQMNYALQAFFANGGGPCYIVSVGDYTGGGVISRTGLEEGLDSAGKVDEITLILFPDGQGLSSAGDYYTLQKAALDQCEQLQDRFTIMDVWIDSDTTIDNVQVLRDTLSGTKDQLKYGAAYYPQLEMRLSYNYNEAEVTVAGGGFLADLESTDNVLYNQAKNVVDNQLFVLLPASSAVAGIYAQVDNARGVWKTPANINVDLAVKPTIKITDQDQENINVDVVAGKSVNAIRSFTGRGPAMVWGGRTLAGNDNEWRYVSVRRFFNMVEESVKKATVQFVFEPNDKNTWTRVKSMIENFLTQQWKVGALMGTTPEEAYYVKIGLNETMTEVDIWEGRMIIEIGMAVVRPAEFIILIFSHKMLNEG